MALTSQYQLRKCIDIIHHSHQFLLLINSKKVALGLFVSKQFLFFSYSYATAEHWQKVIKRTPVYCLVDIAQHSHTPTLVHIACVSRSVNTFDWRFLCWNDVSWMPIWRLAVCVGYWTIFHHKNINKSYSEQSKFIYWKYRITNASPF